jgi:chromosome segregation ATPase
MEKQEIKEQKAALIGLSDHAESLRAEFKKTNGESVFITNEINNLTVINQNITIELIEKEKNRVGTMSPADFLAFESQVKSEIEQNNVKIEKLNTDLTQRQRAAQLLNEDLVRAERKIRQVKQDLLSLMTAQLTCNLTNAPSAQTESLKNLMVLVLATNKDEDFYQKIGVVLCQTLFGELGYNNARMPNINETNQLVNTLIQDI